MEKNNNLSKNNETVTCYTETLMGSAFEQTHQNDIDATGGFREVFEALAIQKLSDLFPAKLAD